ncbi:PREDICTED: CUB and sushi domain-containing protein 1-like [Amphimedon queenslandica]|uniref:Sushi, von Willebrand factor type A, EGF and pentraxin domain-containing protein 1 n=1 Tax=Amphimedon queenslandica TaxID=400682 RepID=A0A1X7VPD3_AMPQE|nr:PREDICTED: CUB and sushi domain-containing protein 1-like [Amphimedon queenslandica]|eukprot:XP_011409624.1 PREDICTED: CUB and sushi domain-containing protein 1-like [Amphimedon queenslandica]
MFALLPALAFLLLFDSSRANSKSQALTRSQLLSFGPGTNDNTLQRGDDMTASIRLSLPFTFYNTTYTELFVSTNGAISLGDDSSSLVNVQFPQDMMDQPLIAPYLADVDTTGIGNVYYRHSNAAADLEYANEFIRNTGTFASSSASQIVVVTWDSVGYYRSKTNKVNTFQCILGWNAQESFAIFLYVNPLLWTTGDANGGRNGVGGMQAQVGFIAGDGSRFFTLPGSGSNFVLALDSDTNIMQPGRYVFQINSDITEPTVVDCGRLQAPMDGSIAFQFDLTTFNSVATYSCNFGFTLIGSANRTCQLNGSWSPDAPTCNVTDCGTLDFDRSTTDVVKNGTGLYAVARYSCIIGYVLQGNSIRTCQTNSMWSGTDPTCEPIVCDKALLFPANTTALTINANRFTFRSIATYTCLPGYVVRSAITRTCQSDGTWSSTPSYCEFINCNNPPTNNEVGLSVQFTSTFLNAQATYSCASGYTFNGTALRTCGTNGQWSGSTPQCIPVDCGMPPGITGRDNLMANFDPSNTTFGNVVVYSCDIGFRLVGSSSLTCLASGSWSGVAPTCQVNDCGPLNPNRPLMVSYNTTIVNSTANYSCETGYEINGNPTSSCQPNGQWSGPEPSCIGVDCGDPPQVAGTGPTRPISSSTSNRFPSVVQYSCITGYELVGSAFISCLPNGSWSSSEVTSRCRPVDCGSPEDESFFLFNDEINVTITSTEFGGIATYRCLEEGMVIDGNDRRVCGADGNWTGTTPTNCTFVDCGIPELPSFGFGGVVRDFNETIFNSTVTYSCDDDDLTPVGEPVRVCQANGQWSGEPLYCRRRTNLFVIGLSIGVTIGGILLLLLLLLLLLICLYCCCAGKKGNTTPKEKKDRFGSRDILVSNENLYRNPAVELPQKNGHAYDEPEVVVMKETTVESTPPPVLPPKPVTPPPPAVVERPAPLLQAEAPPSKKQESNNVTIPRVIPQVGSQEETIDFGPDDPFEGVDDKDIDSVHNFRLHYLGNDDNQSISSDKKYYAI